jgi:putative toxin-antitoxin system antitoxin component (TIGR02293 family)
MQRNIKEKKMLNINQSEKVLEAGRLLHRGLQVFGDQQTFLLWLNTDHPVFSGKPIDYIDTNAGIHLIIDELKRIEHSIY